MKKIYYLLCLLLLLYFKNISAQVTQFRNGVQHAGVYNSTAAFNVVDQQWKFKTGAAIRSTPVVVNGRVFFGNADHYFYCIDTTGKEVWKFKADGAIHSSPAYKNGQVYFNSRENTLYALNALNGKQVWSITLGKTLPYEWGFDYYISSPLVEGNTIYTGSGDGRLYAVDIPSGKIKWNYNTGGMVRSTPAYDKGNIFFGNCSGLVYALNAADGKVKWTFKSNGDTMHNENFGFDRRAVIASPAIANNILVAGGRDGFLYGLNELTGEKIWQFDYRVSWILSTVAIKDSIVVTGTSDGSFINALNLYTGKELWRFQTQAPVWASPIISNDRVICGSNDGILYGLDLSSGKEIWRYRAGEKFFASPVVAGNKIYNGNDDGIMYCLRDIFSSSPVEIYKSVFWMKEPVFQYFRYGVDEYIKNYFQSWGYKSVDENGIKDFLQARINDGKKSILVFATNFFPASICGDSAHESLLLSYLRKGGRVVVCGMNPAVYQTDTIRKEVTGLDFTLAKKILDIDYPYNDTRTFNGWYPAFITPEGKTWGLKTNDVSRVGVPSSIVSVPLMQDETGKITSWVKYFAPSNGSFIQTWLSESSLNTIDEIRAVAEHELF